jgi:hypothetical protein
MHGRIAKLEEGFVTQDVEHSKSALTSARSHPRLRAIGFGKAMNVRDAGRIMALVIPPERPAQGRAQREECSNRGSRWTPVAEHERARVLDAATGAAALEWYRPDIVESDVAEKHVAT